MRLEILYSLIKGNFFTHTDSNDSGLGKGQSAIEYLMTYGWMLLVVAVVGGAVFSMVQGQSVESVSGFSGGDIMVESFGATSGGLQLELMDGSGQGSIIKSINVTDESSGDYVYKKFSSNNEISIGESAIFDLPNISQSDGSNSLDVEVLYNSGGLENMSISGTISGGLIVDDSVEVTDSGSLSGPTASASVNNFNPETGQIIEFDGSSSSPGDGSISGYSWDVDGDGNYEESGETVTHSYSSSGTKNVELNISDSSGLSSSDSITVDVQSTEIVYDFESGDTSNWDKDTNLAAVQDIVYNGSYTGFISNSEDPETLARPYGGDEKRPSKIEYVWYDTQDGHGGGIQFYDASGNPVFELATDNPSWYIIDGNGAEQVYSGDGYGRWVRYTVNIDWEAGTFSVEFRDLQSGSTYTDNGRPLNSDSGIAEFELEHFDQGSFTDDYAIEMWFDDIGFYE